MDVWPRHPIITIPARTSLPVLLSVIHRIGGFVLIVFSHIFMARIAAPGEIIRLHLLVPNHTLRRARIHILHPALTHRA